MKYALVKDNKIKFVTIKDDLILLPKLIAHGYLIVEEQSAPQHDYITQSLTDTYEIQSNKVLKIYTINERSFIEAKQIKKDTIEQEALDKIKDVFDDEQQKTKVDTILNTKDSTITKINIAKDNVELRAITALTSWEIK